METQSETNQNSPAPFGKIKFLEYSTANKGQHFITVIQGKNNIVGRIYREYDDVNKKAVYTAKDKEGNPVFIEEPSLVGIKKAFVQAHKEIKSPEQDLDENTKEPLKVTKCDKAQEREDEIKKARVLKNNLGKQNEISR